MVSIDEIHSDVTVGTTSEGTSEPSEEQEENLIDELREVVRQLIAEEYERVNRTSVTDNGWLR